MEWVVLEVNGVGWSGGVWLGCGIVRLLPPGAKIRAFGWGLVKLEM